jgi:hypothetical protein
LAIVTVRPLFRTENIIGRARSEKIICDYENHQQYFSFF